MSEHVWLNINECQLVVVTYHQHLSFGSWYYPAHGMIYLGEL